MKKVILTTDSSVRSPKRDLKIFRIRLLRFALFVCIEIANLRNRIGDPGVRRRENINYALPFRALNSR